MIDWIDVAARYGLPFALVLVAVLYLFYEKVVPASRVIKIEKRCDDELVRIDKVHAAEMTKQKEGYEMVIVEIRARLAKTEEDRDFYKKFTFEQARALSRATGGLERAVSAFPNVDQDR